jgi:hypothetical protein
MRWLGKLHLWEMGRPWQIIAGAWDEMLIRKTSIASPPPGEPLAVRKKENPAGELPCARKNAKASLAKIPSARIFEIMCFPNPGNKSARGAFVNGR